MCTSYGDEIIFDPSGPRTKTRTDVYDLISKMIIELRRMSRITIAVPSTPGD